MASRVINEKPQPTEAQIQKMVIDYLRFKGVLFNHSPNEGKRSVVNGSQLKRMGMCKGFPDIFVYQPTSKHSGLAIELKREKGYSISPEQKQWIERLNSVGYYAVICKGYDDAQKTIDRYLEEII